jgi:hypothetical protein
MKSFHVLLLLLSFLLFLGSDCNTDDAPSAPGTGDVIMPLKAGTSWTYRGQNIDTLGNVTHTDTVTFAVIGDTTINSEKWYMINGGEMLANRSTGLWYALAGPDGWYVSPGLMAKYPGKAGDAWIGPDSLSSAITAVNVSTVVPHGTYSCYHYTYSSSGQLDAARYFSVNKGLIMDEFYSKTASGRTYVAQRRSLMGLVLTKSSGAPATSAGRFIPLRAR